MRKFLAFVLSCSSLLGTNITLEFLESKPKGLARDFYIWRFLSNENTSLQEATKAYELINRKNPKLIALMKKKGTPHQLPREFFCKSLNIETLLKEDIECISYGLQLSQIPSLPKRELETLKKAVQENKSLYKQVQILSSKAILTNMLNSDAKTFAQIYSQLNQNQKKIIINQNIKPQTLKKLAEQQDPEFDKMLQGIILSDSLPKFKKSLLGAKITKTYNGYTLFLLGINELLANNKKYALQYFKLSELANKNPLFINKALFWQYLLQGDNQILQKLTTSNHIDIYTIYANQKLSTKPSYVILSELENIRGKKAPFDIQDPFAWEILYANLLKVKDTDALDSLISEFAFEYSQAHMAFVHNRATKYKNNYFITPFSQEIKWKNTHQKSLTYAIARQESNFLPALISTSYALGMMQIMPFNVEPFAKNMGIKNIKLEDMFNPVIALEFGRFYIDELEGEFKHPLLVSYAYNGGPGFLRRTLEKKRLFLKNRAFEPWISLELIPYEESRFYGQKVLANYVIYQELFGNNIRLEKLLKEIPLN
ncbi:MAG: lytic transglycosylase domain-containing protein [Helicobacter sp.]|nr:lytic transglycosylase domain-containing protein [Helicobacter sp.]MDY5740506.1 lytic transglycosylase domain-containing protein [Helicobacter sp.]